MTFRSICSYLRRRDGRLSTLTVKPFILTGGTKSDGESYEQHNLLVVGLEAAKGNVINSLYRVQMLTRSWRVSFRTVLFEEALPRTPYLQQAPTT